MTTGIATAFNRISSPEALDIADNMNVSWCRTAMEKVLAALRIRRWDGGKPHFLRHLSFFAPQMRGPRPEPR